MSEETKPTTQPTGNPDPAAPAATAQGKTWTDEYVQSLRGEAKDNRLKAKALEKKFKELIGLMDEDDLDDDKIEGYKKNRQKEIDDVMAKANSRILKAAIKGLDGFDGKLLERLLDRSKVEFDDEGEPKNLAELAEELVKEFPQVKVGAATPQAKPGAANPPTATKTPADEYNDLKELVRKNPYDSALKVKLMKAREALLKK